MRARSLMLRALSNFQGDDEFASVLRGGVLVSFVRVGGIGLAFASQVFLTRWMGAAEMGLYVYALAWAAVLTVIAGLGLPAAALRFIPQYLASYDYARLTGFLRQARFLTLLAGFGIASSIVIFGWYFASWTNEYRAPMLLAAIGIPILALVTLFSEQARSFRAVVAAYLPPGIIRPVLVLAGCAAIVLSGDDLTAVSAIGITLAGLIIVAVVQYLWLKKVIGRKLAISSDEPVYETRRWLHVSLPLLLVAGFMIVLGQSDILMIGVFLSLEDVAIYNAATKTAAFTSFGLVVLNARAAPIIADLFARRRHSELQSLVNKVALWAALPAAVLLAAAIAFGDLALGVFGPSFASGYWALIILACGHTINAAAGPVAFLLNTTGHHKDCMVVFGVSALVNIVLNFLLIPRYGIEGAALATASTMVLWNLALWPLVIKRLNVRPLGVSQIWPSVAG